MKPRKVLAESQVQIRRSSRIIVNAAKRKIQECTVEEEEEEEVKTPKKVNKKEGYFKIFDKKANSRHSSSSKTKKIKNEDRKVTKSKESSNNSVRNGHSKPVAKIPKADPECISIEVDDCKDVCQQPRALPEVNFISSFTEQELPLVCMPSHVQQIVDESSDVSAAVSRIKFISESADTSYAVPDGYNLKNVNGYFNTPDVSSDEFKSKLSDETLMTEDFQIWVEKYKPKCLSNIVGHSAGVELLTNWMSDWKQKLKPRSKSENSNSGYSFDMSDDEDGIHKCFMLTGSSGRGKTSTVYAVAEDLGFRVFEVNPSSSRLGRQVLSDLQEATLSHHVQGTPQISPFFIPFTKVAPQNDSAKKELPSGSERKAAKKKPKPGEITNFFQKADVKSDTKKSPEIKKENKKQNSKNTLLGFFKAQSKPSSPAGNASIKCETSTSDTTSSESTDDENEPKRKALESPTLSSIKITTDVEAVNVMEDVENDTSSSCEVVDMEKHGKANCINSSNACEPERCSKKASKSECSTISAESTPEISKLKFSSLSVILFDDADVNLEPDEGFWSAINSFLKVTRKPVILTANENTRNLHDYISSEISLIDFDTLNGPAAIELLKRINKTESLGLKHSELSFLLRFCNLDLRQCVQQLQFWAGMKNRPLNYSNLFGLSLSVFCLESGIADHIMDWMFDWDCQQASELLYSFLLNKCHLLYSNLNFWLPFKQVPKEKVKVPQVRSKPVKKYKRLDISWLSDEGSDNDDDTMVCDTTLSENSVHEKNETEKENRRNLLQLLEHLSDLYDNFSSADVIQKQDFDVCGSFWNTENCSVMRNAYGSQASTDISSWVSLLSARHFRREIQKIALDGITIYSNEEEYLNIGQVCVPSSKLVHSRQNIADGALSLQRLNHRARCVDYASTLRAISRCEDTRKENNPKRSRRFLHYFESTGFTVEMSDLSTISEAFC